jgi:hypothetical protein
VVPRPAELAQTADVKTDFPLNARRKTERVVPVNELTPTKKKKKKIQSRKNLQRNYEICQRNNNFRRDFFMKCRRVVWITLDDLEQ